MKEFNKDEVTMIGSGVVIEGKLTSSSNIRIDGKIKGDVSAIGNLIVGETGEINGEVSADTINLGGKVTGTVRAKDKLTLENKSFLKGDLITKILVIEGGAIFEGRSSMGSLKPEPGKPAEPPKPGSTPVNEQK